MGWNFMLFATGLYATWRLNKKASAFAAAKTPRFLLPGYANVFRACLAQAVGNKCPGGWGNAKPAVCSGL